MRAHPGSRLAFPIVCRHAACDDLAMGEIIVYSGSILVIVCEVTGHKVAFPPLISSHRFIFGRHTERNARMKRSSYGEPDYAFGQAMLTLRTTIGPTQAGVAEQLGVPRTAVGEWEAGLNYPQGAHLKALIGLAGEKRACTAGCEGEER